MAREMLTAVTAVCRHGVCPLEFLPMTAIDYLLIGHITRDLTPHGDEPGGTVTYSGRAAAALGSHTTVLTSYAPDFTSSQVLADLHVHNVPSAATTTFENVYTPHGRAQTVHATATTLTPDHLPEPWGEPAIVHLAPVVLNQASNEIPRQYLSSQKARRMLDWAPSFDLRTGLARTIAWYRDYFNQHTEVLDD